MRAPLWLSGEFVDHVHAQLIREHGGSYGIRDRGLIESALARPRNRWQYENRTDLAALAAAYAFGLARNHGYVDGNKRVAFMAAYSFLDANGLHLTASEAEAYAVFLDLAAGNLSEDDLTLWLRASVE
ncbi:MAG TPA: type II toxin-antitoxin system death-on-curing family toxin [Longimicrobiaceae bacterium]|nr:type II toxin-antitoxin system death-on-curing family toxin [Longimicrobiaceae bacterium]